MARGGPSSAAASRRGQQQQDKEQQQGDEQEPFYVGFAISTYQNSGDPNTNWGAWERGRTAFCGRPIRGGDKCGIACNFWELFREDIARAVEMGSNCFRFSLEWSRLEPEQGRIDQSAVARYHEMLDCLERHGLQPFLTLHHFVHPLWFERLGGFTKEENISLFVEYAQLAYKLFGKRVKYWTTFNEPNVCSFAGFIYGSFPPGRVGALEACGRHMLNMLRAHAEAYKAIRALPGGAAAKIGLVWNWFWFEAKRACFGCCMPPYLPALCAVLNRGWGNQLLLSFLGRGEYDWQPIPWLTSRVQYQEPGGRPGCDYVGLNYYSRGVMDWKLAATCYEGEMMTDMPYALYPQGMTLALHHLKELELPVYITETGVADQGDDLRAAMVQGYMAEAEAAVARGYDLRGLMYWSLTDNFEWAEGYYMRFGIYEWNDDGSQERRLRPSGKLLRQWFQQLPGRVAALLEQRRQRPQRLPGGSKEGKEDGERLPHRMKAPKPLVATA